MESFLKNTKLTKNCDLTQCKTNTECGQDSSVLQESDFPPIPGSAPLASLTLKAAVSSPWNRSSHASPCSTSSAKSALSYDRAQSQKLKKKSSQKTKAKGTAKWVAKTTTKAAAVLSGCADAMGEKQGTIDTLKAIIREQQDVINETQETKEEPEPPVVHPPPIEGNCWVTYHDPVRTCGWVGWLARKAEQIVKIPTVAAIRIGSRLDDVVGGPVTYVAERVRAFVAPIAEHMLELTNLEMDSHVNECSPLGRHALFGDAEIFIRNTLGIPDDTGKIPLGRYRLISYTRVPTPASFQNPSLHSGAKIINTRTTIGLYDVQEQATTKHSRVMAFTELARQLSAKTHTSEAMRITTINKMTFNALSSLPNDADKTPVLTAGTKLMAQLYGVDINTALHDRDALNFGGGGFSMLVTQSLTLLATDTALERSLFASLNRLAQALKSKWLSMYLPSVAYLSARLGPYFAGWHHRLLTAIIRPLCWLAACTDTVVSSLTKMCGFLWNSRISPKHGFAYISRHCSLAILKNMKNSSIAALTRKREKPNFWISFQKIYSSALGMT